METVEPDVASPPFRVVRTVLVVDLVESVRLIERDEEDVVRRWRSLVHQVQSEILPAQGGRLVKSLGDGLMLDFPTVRPAVKAAFAIGRACVRVNEGLPADRHMLLRMGAHVCPLIADELDVYGHGVNLAARLTSLAGPGELVVSADVRDQLTPELDADVEDLGLCRLKHVSEAVRAYRVGPPGPRPVIAPGENRMEELVPAIAVIPFTARTGDPRDEVFGDILADEVISGLSRASELRVISRLSTGAFRSRDFALGDVSSHLRASYVLSGAYRVSGSRLLLAAELAETASGKIVWAQSLRGDTRAIVAGDDEIVGELVAQTSAAMMMRELERAQALALPSLESYTLLMGAIVLMHRGGSVDFERAGRMLEALIERAPRQAAPHAWLAKWHVLRFNRNWSNDPQREAEVALDCTRRALEADPACSLALTVDGFVHTNLLKDLDTGEERYNAAIGVNPNDSLAWLLKGTLHAFKGDGEVAVDSTERALQLSPLDPMRYFYDSLAATAALAAGRLDRAVELARRSLRANRVHTSTLRALAISNALLGNLDEAREAVKELLEREPTLTVRKYLERSPSGDYETGKLWSGALKLAGLPD